MRNGRTCPPGQYFDHAGVYILVGYAEDANEDDPTKDVPTIYVGEEPYGDGKKYKLVFSEPAKPIGPVPFADAALAIVGPRYTNHLQLLAAKKLTDLWPNQ